MKRVALTQPAMRIIDIEYSNKFYMLLLDRDPLQHWAN